MRNSNFLNVIIFLVFIIFIAGCSLKVEKEITEETTEDVADTGALVVESFPSLAEVYIGEEYRGDTPLTLYNIPVGQYFITIKKQGYEDFKKTVTIKVGKTEEIEAQLNPIAPVKTTIEEKKPLGETKPESTSAQMPKFNKINLSSFAMYYDFEKVQFTDVRTDKSDLFSRKYDVYVHFTALTPAKVYVLNKPIKDVQKEDCIFSDNAVALVYSGQTLCVKTMEGNIVAVGGSWQAMPTELEWIVFS